MKRKLTALKASAAARVEAARAEHPALDHLVRAKARYDDRRGDRQAAAVTFFGFLSFFPLIALAFAVLGYVISFYPSVHQDIQRGISEALPGLVGTAPGQINIDQIASAKAGAGIIGLVGLFWAGTAWVDALREALRSMWLQEAKGGGNVVKKKLFDAIVLVVLGLSLILSVALSSIATSATGVIIDLFNLPQGGLTTWLLKLVALVISVGSSALLFGVMFWRLSGMRIPRKRLLQGALLGGIGFELLKMLATYLIGNTMRNPVYATFAVAVGLLVWINWVSRVTLFSAAWTATDAYTDEVVGDPIMLEESLDPADQAVLDSESVPVDAQAAEKDPAAEKEPASHHLGLLGRLRQRGHADDEAPAGVPQDSDDFDPWEHSIPEALHQDDARIK
jgi:membrane protein